MINLVSSDAKKQLVAARNNVLLRKYVWTLVVLIALITASYAVTYAILIKQSKVYEQEVARYAPQKQEFADVIKQATEYNKNLTIAKSILGSEITFSDFLLTIAQTLPDNTALVGINLKTTDLEKPVELLLMAKTYDDALAIKDAFQESPYFSDVQLRTVGKTLTGDYPYSLTIISKINSDKIIQDSNNEVTP